MDTSAYQLAQVNIARMLGPIDGPVMAEFVALLDEINALAESSPGFVWRLKTEDGNATSLRPYDDDRIIVNMSVWESAEHLKAYVYKSAHTAAMRRRRQWFEPMKSAYVALWWIPAGHIPSVEEAKQHLELLEKHGETAEAFSFKLLFPPPVGKTELRQLQH